MFDIAIAFIYVAAFIGIYTSVFFLITLYENWSRIKVKKTTNYRSVTVVVPCYNEEKTIVKTLKSLLALDYPNDKLKIVVVDDGSTDDTYNKALKFKSSQIKVLKKKNGGKHTALNLALKNIHTELVGCLDADSTVAKDSLRKIVNQFYSSKVMAVTPSMKINNPEGILRRVQATEFMLGILMRRVFTDLGSQNVTPGPFTIFRKEFFEKHGVYRKAHNTEDIEVALRIQSKNYIIENATDAFVYTHGPSGFKALYKQRLRWYYGFLSNVLDYKELFGRKHGNLGLFILPMSLISVGLAITGGMIFLIKTLSSWYKTIHHYYLIGFDWKEMISLNWDSFFINTSNVMIISLISLVLGIILFYFAWKLSGEKRAWKWNYVLFIIFYWVLYAYWWGASIYKKLSGQKTVWVHKNEYDSKKPKSGEGNKTQ